MIAVSGTDIQGASIPIRGVYLHGVSRSAAAVLANLVRKFLNVDRLFEVAGEAVGQEPGDPDTRGQYAERGSPKYEKAAMRWLERYLTEGSPRLQHFADVAARLTRRDPENGERD